MMTFSLDNGRAFEFDVKATDREGSETGHSALTNVIIYVLPETKLIMIVSHMRPLVMEQNIDEVLGYLSNTTGYKIQMAKLQSHHEGEEEEDPESTDLFLYGIERETNKIVNTESLLKLFIKKSDAISEDLAQFRIRKIQGVSVQEKISHMGTTEIAIIALSSVIFLGGVLGIALLCSTCKKRKTKQQQEKWEQQRVYSVRNPLIDRTVGPPYERRVANGIVVLHPPSYSNATSNTEFIYSRVDQNSILKGNKSSRQHVPPDGASSPTRSKSPKSDGFIKKNCQWEDQKDEIDSFGTRFSRASRFDSWSSRHTKRSRPNSSTEI
ncbi:cadherin-89D-like [Limulus polyphemus]|uniref:Cadherin-89D-like n=1 Tax=Limulus polyphemus TaxID=6850 RepID=A0ABM1TP20_LIMPO|nr:cadherin-89D-like [Limulus polyphemus]